MSFVTGRVYDCKPEDLASLPIEVQVRMYEGGRLRSARYEGDGQWHILSDAEMLLHQDAAITPVLSSEPTVPTLKLDLGCGRRVKEGFEGVDLYSKEATHQVDLFKFPWPWADECVGTLYSSHFLEHVPARDVEERDIRTKSHIDQFLDQDFLFAIMDECWRILAPGAVFTIVVPNARSDGAFQDPTHRRFWNQMTFAYFQKHRREELDVGHYRTVTDFELIQLTPVGPVEIGLMHPEVQQKKWRAEWNAIFEWHAQFRKPSPG
jgi:hypothetical protein